MDFNFDDNREFLLAWRLVEHTGANLFLTGKAGTGKTTFLRMLREKSAKRIVTLAPTGIAAINARGVTIHSFFQLPPTPFVPGMKTSEGQKRYDRFSKEKIRLIRTLDLLVIDEISMVRADLLDAVDAALRRHRDPWKPFGGVQLLIIGDLGQLAPVLKDVDREFFAPYYETPYFFSSHALQQAGYETVELTKIYRQSDRHFVEILNSVRAGRVEKPLLDRLNSRYIPGFNPPDKDGYIRLTTHNVRAQHINDARMALLPSPPHSYAAKVSGDFPESSYPVDKSLVLKEGAQVMFIRNDINHRYFNGLIGVVLSCGSDFVEVIPTGETDSIKVEAVTWENSQFKLDAATGTISEDIVGTFSQLPLKPAWAVTIHKSQGLTFDHAIIDAASSFAHGQTYVALSRCRTLEGLVLDSPLSPSAFINDSKVESYIDSRRSSMADEHRVASLAEAYRRFLLMELFDFGNMRRMFNSLHRLVEEFLAGAYPRLAEQYAKGDVSLQNEVEAVAVRFRTLCASLLAPESADRLNERVNAAAKYFSDLLGKFIVLTQGTPTAADNKTAAKRLKTAVDDIHDELFVRQQTMRAFLSAPFEPKTLLDARAKAKMALVADDSKAKKSREKKISIPVDVNDRNLYKALVQWRSELCNKFNIPAYVVLSNKALVGIANATPRTRFELLAIPGVGNKKVQQYGKDIIELIDKYLES